MKFWSKIFLKSLFVTVVTSIALFFAHTSTYATTFWIFEQPRIPEKLLKNNYNFVISRAVRYYHSLPYFCSSMHYYFLHKKIAINICVVKHIIILV